MASGAARIQRLHAGHHQGGAQYHRRRGQRKFCVDLGAAYALRAFALVNHNLSAAAQWRILLGTTAGARMSSAGTLADWLSATFDASMAALGMQDAEYLRGGTPAIIVLPTTQSARYVTVEISDTSNPNNYVQVGRFFTGGGFVPSYNATQLRDSWVDLSTRIAASQVPCGTMARRRLRRVQLVLEGLSLDEGDLARDAARAGHRRRSAVRAQPVQHGPVAALRDAGHDRRDVGTGLPVLPRAATAACHHAEG